MKNYGHYLLLICLFVITSCSTKPTYWEQLDLDEQNEILAKPYIGKEVRAFCQNNYQIPKNINWDNLWDNLSKNDNEDKQKLHFYVIIRLMDVIDGEPAEVMPIICLDFVKNNLDFVLPYFHDHPDIQKKFAFEIGWELYYDDMSLDDFEKELVVPKDSKRKSYLYDFLLVLMKEIKSTDYD